MKEYLLLTIHMGNIVCVSGVCHRVGGIKLEDAFEGHHCLLSDDRPDRLYPGQLHYELSMDAVAEDILLGILGLIHKGEDGDGVEGLAALGEEKEDGDGSENDKAGKRRISKFLLESENFSAQEARFGPDGLYSFGDGLQILKQLVHASEEVLCYNKPDEKDSAVPGLRTRGGRGGGVGIRRSKR
jgi:hypothetical protein